MSGFMASGRGPILITRAVLWRVPASGATACTPPSLRVITPLIRGTMTRNVRWHAMNRPGRGGIPRRGWR